MRLERLPNNPIITRETPGGVPEMMDNINGPSLIRVPDWVENPLGKYYLYFSHHRHNHIRLAYADALEGPWSIHTPGVLQLESSYFVDHVASPDAYIDHDKKQIRLYVHGFLNDDDQAIAAKNPEIDEFFFTSQRSRVAVSRDGLNFTVQQPIVAGAYLRVFPFKGLDYAVAMPGLLYRSQTGFGEFERGPNILGDRENPSSNFHPKGIAYPRHLAVQVMDANTFRLFYTMAQDTPEHIVVSTVDASHDDWWMWQASPPVSVLRPETDYEGANLPLETSERGKIMGMVRQLRDPDVFQDADGSVYVVYAAAGEHSLAIAQLFEN